jgi:hypothetical protein
MYKKILGLLAVVILAACATTKLTATWSAEPSKSYHFNSIAIVGAANRPEIRKIFEDALESLLDSKGFNTTGALMFFPPNASKENISKDIAIQFIQAGQFDAVITISLVRKEENTTYVPGQYYYTPYYNAPFYDYYGMSSNYAYSPGYYEQSVSVLLQTNLYSFPDGAILWSAQTNTSSLDQISQTAEELATILANELVNSKIIVP